MTLDELTKGAHELAGQYAARGARVTELEQHIVVLKEETALLTMVEAALAKLLAQTSAESLKHVEDTITYGLQTVFDDLTLGFKLRVGMTRGQQSLEPVLIVGDVEAPVLDAFGGGPATVIAFLLRLLVAQKQGLAPLLVLDETFAMVSAEYVPNVAKLLRELAAKMSLTILLVTHQDAFLDHADRAYVVAGMPDSPAGVTFKSLR